MSQNDWIGVLGGLALYAIAMWRYGEGGFLQRIGYTDDDGKKNGWQVAVMVFAFLFFSAG